MKISTKGRYTLEAVVDLAYNSKDKLESLKHVSDRTKLSKNYLEQQFLLLKKRGLLKSVRGAQGGYALARAASEITVGDILRAVEGNLSPVACIETGECIQSCGDFSTCVSKTVWQAMMVEIEDVIDNITIEALVEAYSQAEEMPFTAFYI